MDAIWVRSLGRAVIDNGEVPAYFGFDRPECRHSRLKLIAGFCKLRDSTAGWRAELIDRRAGVCLFDWGSIMKPYLAFAAVAAVFSSPVVGASSDAAIRQTMIKESIAAYPGNCPCPYNTDRAGRSCGRRSAWSRAGGYSPLCYSADISKGDVEEFRRNHR